MVVTRKTKCRRFNCLGLPLFTSIPAGFPSPASEYKEDRIYLNEWLIKKPFATFFVKVEGESILRWILFRKKWKPKAGQLSKRYTTNINEPLIIKIRSHVQSIFILK